MIFANLAGNAKCRWEDRIAGAMSLRGVATMTLVTCMVTAAFSFLLV